MKHILLITALLLIAAGLLGQAPASRPQPPAPAARALADARFVTCDIFVDSGASRLAAWQVDVQGTIPGGAVELVGVEGGSPGVYAQPAYYDPEALTRNHVILAAFSTAKPETLPVGSSRVARLHLRVTGSGKPVFACKLIAAADADGKPITPAATATLGDTP